MGRKPWTTKEQAEFLIDRQDEFSEAQTASNTPDFFASVQNDFLKTFPPPAPSAADLAKASGDAVKAAENVEKLWRDVCLSSAIYQTQPS